MDIERRCVEILVDQGIEYGIFHSLEDDIRNAEIPEQIQQLKTLAMEINEEHSLKPSEVYRVVLGIPGENRIQTIYLNKESLANMMEQGDNYNTLLDKVQNAIKRKDEQQEDVFDEDIEMG